MRTRGAVLWHYGAGQPPGLKLWVKKKKRKHCTVFVFISENLFFSGKSTANCFQWSTLIYHLNDCTFWTFLHRENTSQTFMALMFVHTGCNITVYVSEDTWAVNFLQLRSVMDVGALRLRYDMYWFGRAAPYTWLCNLFIRLWTSDTSLVLNLQECQGTWCGCWGTKYFPIFCFFSFRYSICSNVFGLTINLMIESNVPIRHLASSLWWVYMD